MDDDYGADDALLAAMASADPGQVSRPAIQQPRPRKVQQPTPQRLDKAPPTSSGGKIVQPTPQALPQRQGLSNILVSPRQRGNPVLTHIKSMPWEYSDIPADFVMGITNCALFLSLKYHRLHPEYVYTRIRNLQGKYNLRILLTMVDIPNHEDPLRELSKTSMVNNVTIICCWSAAEAARYIELYKSYEHANFDAIKGKQAFTYADKLVEFVTVPRSLNKSDAVALVANFGSLRNAINADAEQLGTLSGWGGVKIKRWNAAIGEPFRSKKAAKRGMQVGNDSQGASRMEQAVPLSRVPLRDMPRAAQAEHGSSMSKTPDQATQDTVGGAGQFQFRGDLDSDSDDNTSAAASMLQPKGTSQRTIGGSSQKQSQSQSNDELSSGIAAALAKLRDQ